MTRRRFLETTAAAAAAGLAPAFVKELGAATPIRVGVLLPLSRVMASLGDSTLSGVMFGRKELGGEIDGRPVQLITEDDASDPSLGLSKLRKLVEKDGVDVVIGPVSSAVAAAIRNYIVDAKRLWLNPIAVNDTLAEKECTRYHFRFSASAWQIASPVGPWGKAKQSFTAAGGTIVGEAYPPLGTSNYAPYFPPIRDARPAFLYVNVIGSDAVAFIKQYAEFGLKPIKMIGPVSLVSEDVLSAQGEAAAGVYSLSYYTPSYDIPRNRWFAQAYKAFAPSKEPDHFNSAGFDVMQALYGALRAARGDVANKDRLIEWIEQARIDSPRGPLRFDPKNHNPIQDLHVRVVESNPLRSVVIDSLKESTHPDRGCRLA
jgi:branched-chain amino acid transport system substrate-binding protein